MIFMMLGYAHRKKSFVCDAVAPDTLLGLKLQDNSACARLHSAVLLHYHMKFQVNQRVNLEASCCALFCYEYLLALYGRDAFLSVMLWLLTHCWASSCRTTLLVHACTQQCCSTTTWSSRWTKGLTWRLHAVHCSAMSICVLSMGGMPFVCDALAPDTMLGLKLQDSCAFARWHAGVLLLQGLTWRFFAVYTLLRCYFTSLCCCCFLRTILPSISSHTWSATY